MYRILVNGVYMATFESFDCAVAYILAFCSGKTVTMQCLEDDE